MNIVQRFADLSLDHMNSVLAELVVIRDEKLYKSRNFVIMDTEIVSIDIDYIWATLFKFLIEKLKKYIIVKKQYIVNSILRSKYVYRSYILPPKTLLMYREPTRGNLPLLCKIYNININEYQRGLTWIYLKNIIVYWYQENIQQNVQLEYKDHQVMQKNHLTNVYTRVLVPDYGFDINGKFAKFLLTLSQVCKEWRVVLKSMCMWWGPAGGRDFAFIKGSINHLVRDKKKV